MPEQIENEIESKVDAVSSSGQNVLNTVAKAIGLDIRSLSLQNIIGSVVLLIILIAISKILRGIFARAFRKSKLTESMKKFIVRVVKYMMYFLPILIFCDSLGMLWGPFRRF